MQHGTFWIFGQCLRLLSPFRAQFVMLLVFQVLMTLSDLAIVLGIRWTIDRAVATRDFQFLLGMALALIASLVVLQITTVLNNYLACRLTAKIVSRTLDKILFPSLLRRPAQYFQRASETDILSLFSKDTQLLETTLIKFFTMIKFLIGFVGYIAVTMQLSTVYGLMLVLLYCLVYALPTRPLNQRAIASAQARQAAHADAVQTVREVIAGWAQVKLYSLQSDFATKFSTQVDILARHLDRMHFFGQLLPELGYSLGMGLQVLVLCLGSYLAMVQLSTHVSVGAVASMLMSGKNFGGCVNRVVALFPDLSNGIGAFENLYTFLGDTNTADRSIRAKQSWEVVHDGWSEHWPIDSNHDTNMPSSCDIAFHHVSFMYNTIDGPVLKNLNFKVPEGAFVGIVGPSGCGKSTVFQLLTRFVDPTAGTIEIGGKDIRRIRADEYLAALAVVTQQPFLFSATVRDNIRMGRHGANEEEIIEAAKAADLHKEIVECLPEGYDTFVNDKSLSGGQKQRLSVARALLRLGHNGARLLLLDEPTSALDGAAAANVNRAIRRKAKEYGVTVLYITHDARLATKFDLLLVLDRGEFVEFGDPKERALQASPGDGNDKEIVEGYWVRRLSASVTLPSPVGSPLLPRNTLC